MILDLVQGTDTIIETRLQEFDFVSRYFCPKYGINEDPVTGSAHTTLIPYWAEKLGKDKLHAKQVSQRGGELFCENLKTKRYLSQFEIGLSDNLLDFQDVKNLANLIQLVAAPTLNSL